MIWTIGLRWQSFFGVARRRLPIGERTSLWLCSPRRNPTLQPACPVGLGMTFPGGARGTRRRPVPNRRGAQQTNPTFAPGLLQRCDQLWPRGRRNQSTKRCLLGGTGAADTCSRGDLAHSSWRIERADPAAEHAESTERGSFSAYFACSGWGLIRLCAVCP